MQSSIAQCTIGWLLFTTWLTCCFGLPSCRKTPDRKVIVHGKVIEYGTKEPVPDARIYVICYDGAIFGSPSSTLADSILTDADGRFYREYEDSELCNGVYLIPYKEGYFKGGEIDLTTNNEEHEVVLVPEAWLKINTIPDEGGSSISISGSNFYGAAGFKTYSYKGDTSYLFKTTGNDLKNIRWYSGPNYEILHQDSLFLPSHDTLTYIIHY